MTDSLDFWFATAWNFFLVLTLLVVAVFGLGGLVVLALGMILERRRERREAELVRRAKGAFFLKWPSRPKGWRR